MGPRGVPAMKAVSNDYQPRTMDELEHDALLVLSRDRLMRCGSIGERIFGDHVVTWRGSAPFARIAGKVMRRLEKRGLAVTRANRHGDWGWCLTLAGQRERDRE